MDIIKVHYDEELQGVYGDDCRYLFDVSEKKLGEEVVKRINMHDELVKSLHDMVEVVGGNINLDEMSDFSVIKLKDFLELTGWGRTTMWRRLKEGKTPKMLMEDGVCRGCTYKAYKEWINSLQQN